MFISTQSDNGLVCDNVFILNHSWPSIIHKPLVEEKCNHKYT